MAKFYATDGTLIEDGPRMSGAHAIGQGVRLNYKDYRVVGSKVTPDGDEDVTLEPCEICPKCGGVKGNLSKDNGCNPSFCR